MLVPAMIATAGAGGIVLRRPLHRQHLQPQHERPDASRLAFFTWHEARGLAELGAIRTHHLSAYIINAVFVAPLSSAALTSSGDLKTPVIVCGLVRVMIKR